MSEPGLHVEDLSYSYGSKSALKDVKFSVPTGAFCALLGPNGAGKSTLFALLTRLITASGGKIEIVGTDLVNQPTQALSKMGVVFQQPTLDLDLTVQQNMLYYAALHGIAKTQAKPLIEKSLAELDMAERAGEKVRALNGGHRRRMEIARALLHEPDVLLLDEPTVGLDAATRHHITDHVHELTKSKGLTVLWATHLVDEVSPQDQLIILHKGSVVADGICSKIIGSGSLAETFASLTDGEAA